MTNLNTNLLKDLVPRFHNFLKSEEGQKWQEEREEKNAFFAEYFAKDKLPDLEEGTLREMIHLLWSFNGWTNKDWLFQEMLKSGLPTIREAFSTLLYSSEPLAKRFNKVKDNVRIMGAASVSEVLVHRDPQKYPIWNRRSRKGLIGLGIDKSKLPKSSQISGSQYESFCTLVRRARQQVAQRYPEFDDLLKFDFLLYYASTQMPVESTKKVILEKPTTVEDFDHDGVISEVLELGDGLGFEVQKEFHVMRGCRIDALWRSRVANLGTIAYAFEVHRHGSRDSAILNLQRVKRDPTIQKVIIVSTQDEIERFKGEIAYLAEDFRRSVGYFDVQDLEQALEHLEALKDILDDLGLLSADSLFD
jgi:hypothetical protein